MSKGLPEKLPYTLSKEQELIRIYWKKGHIAGFFFDGIINVNHTHNLTITSHPIQSGANISDHAYVEPVELNIKLIMSDAFPDSMKVSKNSESYFVGNGRTRSIGAYKILRELQSQKRVFDVGTKFETYSNMMITSISVSESSESVNGLDATISLKQILVANERYIKASVRPQTVDESSPVNQQVEDVTLTYDLLIYKTLTNQLNMKELHDYQYDQYKGYDGITKLFLDHASYDIDTMDKYAEYRISLDVDPKQEFLNGTITWDEYRDYLSLMSPAG